MSIVYLNLPSSLICRTCIYGRGFIYFIKVLMYSSLYYNKFTYLFHILTTASPATYPHVTFPHMPSTLYPQCTHLLLFIEGRDSCINTLLAMVFQKSPKCNEWSRSCPIASAVSETSGASLTISHKKTYWLAFCQVFRNESLQREG